MSTPAGWEALFARRTLGVRLGLEAVRDAHRALGEPAARFPAVHILGTNGKGSTAAMLAHLLRRAGKKVGLYTSPHLHRVGERVQVDGVPVDDDALLAQVQRVLALEPGLGLPRPLSFFELLTLAALAELADHRVDVAVVEAGLGGRLDATRLVTPRVSVLTRVAMDHQGFLGNTLAAIAGEKVAALVSGVPCVCAPQEPEARAVVEAEATSREIPLQWPQPLYRAPKGLPGAHQAQNAALALAAAETMLDVPVDAVELDDARWPGRLEVQSHGSGHVVFDVAHNPDGIAALVAAAPGVPSPDHIVFGCHDDKDEATMVQTLRGLGVPLVRVGPHTALADDERSFPLEGEGLWDWVSGRLEAGDTVWVCGSHGLVGDLRGRAMGATRAPDPGDPRGPVGIFGDDRRGG